MTTIEAHDIIRKTIDDGRLTSMELVRRQAEKLKGYPASNMARTMNTIDRVIAQELSYEKD